MKITRLRSFSYRVGWAMPILQLLVWIQIFIPSTILAHTNCENYLSCHQTPESSEKVDYWTNYFFKLLRPEMRHKRVRMHHRLYRREIVEIRRVVAKVVYESCQRPDTNYYLLSKREQEISILNRRRGLNRQEENEKNYLDRDNDEKHSNYYGDELLWDEELWKDGYYWEHTENYFFDGLYQDLTNAVFYARHPELSRDIKIKANLNLATEWNFIRQYFVDFEEEKFLKQHLIPLCNRKKY